MPDTQNPYPTTGDDIPRRQREWQAAYGAPPTTTAPSPVLPPFPPPGGDVYTPPYIPGPTIPPPGGDWNTIQPIPGAGPGTGQQTAAMYPGQQATVTKTYPDYSQFINRLLTNYPNGRGF